MGRIANMIRGLFGRKPADQHKISMKQPQTGSKKSAQPEPEKMVQKIPVEEKIRKEVSDMELQKDNTLAAEAQTAEENAQETGVSEITVHETGEQ